MSKAQGLAFENKFGEWLKKNSQYSFKLNDTRTLRAQIQAIKQAGQYFHSRSLITGQTPCDYVSVTSGKATLWECKSTVSTAWAIDLIKPHQLDALFKAKKAGAEAYVVLNYHSRDMRLKGSYSHTFILDPETITNFKYVENRKSIPLSWCTEHCRIILDLGSGMEGEQLLRDTSHPFGTSPSSPPKSDVQTVEVAKGAEEEGASGHPGPRQIKTSQELPPTKEETK